MDHDRNPPSSLAVAREAEYRWWMALSLFLLIGLIAAIRYLGPAPRTRDAEGVSAARAIETLDLLLGEQQPTHAAGSRENEYVRVRLLGALSELNAQTWVLPLSQLNSDGKADGKRAGMANIVARIDGQPRARPLVLSTHYDSCPYGPGAGDAGQCVAAILETLRVLKEQPLKHELWCVLTDGEERGMWGATDLTQRSDLPWGSAKPLVINFDARGDQGAVLLYETHVENLRAMQIAGPALAAPSVSTSLMVNIYQRLPNATDFTPYRKSGWAGWNFAVIGGAERYHTPNDTIQNLSRRSIQHFASHASNLVRKIDTLPPEQLQSIDDSERAVFFDLLGLTLLVYPATWNWWHLAAATVLWLVGWFFTTVPHGRVSRLLLVVGLIAVALVISGVAGWAITLALKSADVLPRRYINYGEIVCLLYPAAAAWIVLALARSLSIRCTRAEILSGIALVLLLIGAIACAKLPGGAYLLLLPACALSGLLAISGRWPLPRWSDRWFGLIACSVPALLYAPTYVLLAQAMGATYGTLITTGVALMLLPTILAYAPTTTTGQHRE